MLNHLLPYIDFNYYISNKRTFSYLSFFPVYKNYTYNIPARICRINSTFFKKCGVIILRKF